MREAAIEAAGDGLLDVLEHLDTREGWVRESWWEAACYEAARAGQLRVIAFLLTARISIKGCLIPVGPPTPPPPPSPTSAHVRLPAVRLPKWGSWLFGQEQDQNLRLPHPGAPPPPPPPPHLTSADGSLPAVHTSHTSLVLVGGCVL